MPILLIETATSVCSVAIGEKGSIVAERSTSEPNAHSSKLNSFVSELFKEAGMKPADLTAVCVSGGPGSYTGLRIGVSSAIFGALYGSVFGFEDLLDPVYENLGISFLPLKAMENTNLIIFGAVGIGAAIIVISILVNIIVRLRRRNFEEAIFGNNGLAGLIFFSALLIIVVGILTGHTIITKPFIIGLIVVPLLMIFSREPLGALLEKKHYEMPPIGDFIASNFFECFEFLLGYATNTLSFIRVGGFVFSHAGLMSVVMLLSLLSFFPLFATYQMPHPMPTFVAYLLLSVASLIFPKLLWMVSAYWGLQIYLRAFSFRCLVASLLAILLPYWFYGGIAVITSSLPDLVAHARAVIDFQWYGYATLNRNDLLTFAFVLLLFLSGTIDFYLHSFLDKTRTRILHHVIILHGLFVTFLQCLMPQYVSIFLPLLLVDAAILFGHFFTLTHTRFSHLYNLFLLALALLVVAAQYVKL